MTAAPAAQRLPGSVAFPPGFAGALAQFIYDQAHRPVAEVAIVGALGLLAGVCGREWCIPGSGLNVYVVLVARSAIGKEAMHSGISRIIAAARPKYEKAGDFVTFDDFASGPALVKHVLNAPRSVNVAGELGHKFAAMAKGTENAMTTLRRQLTNLYSKSGRGNVAGGIAYSNQENNVASVEAAAFSLIGETTPGTFYESITDAMMRDGFMSRFSVIEYTGERPPKNTNRRDEPDPALVDWLVAMMRQAHMMDARGLFQDVAFDPTARSMLDAFDDECDGAISAAGDDESRRQMWNRAHLKAKRIAALLAVGDHYLLPTVSGLHVEWAINLVRHDIAVFSKRIENGDVGEGSDGGRERKLLELCREYVLLADENVPKWARKYDDARKVCVVPHSYLSQKTQRLAVFENHPRGHSAALGIAVSAAIDNGRLSLVSPAALDRYGLSSKGKMYAIKDLDRH